MAKERETNQGLGADEVGKKDAGTRPPREDVKEGRGGAQADKISGETSKGAQKRGGRNNTSRGRG